MIEGVELKEVDLIKLNELFLNYILCKNAYENFKKHLLCSWWVFYKIHKDDYWMDTFSDR